MRNGVEWNIVVADGSPDHNVPTVSKASAHGGPARKCAASSATTVGRGDLVVEPGVGAPSPLWSRSMGAVPPIAGPWRDPDRCRSPCSRQRCSRAVSGVGLQHFLGRSNKYALWEAAPFTEQTAVVALLCAIEGVAEHARPVWPQLHRRRMNSPSAEPLSMAMAELDDLRTVGAQLLQFVSGCSVRPT